MTTEIADALRAVLPPGTVLTESDVLEEYAHDDAEWAPCDHPAAVVFARSLDDVVATVRSCHQLPARPDEPWQGVPDHDR